MVFQACREQRELIRVLKSTDEDDLVGGYRLKDGQIWQNGPVTRQWREVVLLLDEIVLPVTRLCIYNLGFWRC